MEISACTFLCYPDFLCILYHVLYTFYIVDQIKSVKQKRPKNFYGGATFNSSFPIRQVAMSSALNISGARAFFVRFNRLFQELLGSFGHQQPQKATI